MEYFFVAVFSAMLLYGICKYNFVAVSFMVLIATLTLFCIFEGTVDNPGVHNKASAPRCTCGITRDTTEKAAE